MYFIVGGVRMCVLATRVAGSILQDFGQSGPPPPPFTADSPGCSVEAASRLSKSKLPQNKRTRYIYIYIYLYSAASTERCVT